MNTTIYMPLMNEGTDVWRPVLATDLGEGRFQITSEPSVDEEWAFAPGMTVVLDVDKRIIAEARP